MHAGMGGVESVTRAGGEPSGAGTLGRGAVAGFDVEALETERLEAEITTLAGHIAAATCRWLLLVGEFDRRQAWGSWGCNSCAHWLSWQCAMGLRAAREHVRVARALAGLPAIREAFAAGRLSYSQARALTRVAEPEREEELLALARHATAAQLERLVRGYLKASALREQARDAYDRRELVWWHDDDGSLVIQARLPADDGALVLEALQARADGLREGDRGAGAGAPPAQGASETAGECSAEQRPPRRRPPRALLADALTELARGAGDGDAPARELSSLAKKTSASAVATAIRSVSPFTAGECQSRWPRHWHGQPTLAVRAPVRSLLPGQPRRITDAPHNLTVENSVNHPPVVVAGGRRPMSARCTA